MTTANKITIFRILLVPFFVIQLLYYFRGGLESHRILALIAFALAAVSDGLDGYIARRFNQKSALGAILDPLADKLLLVSAIILLSCDSGDHFARIPLWLTVTLISRDVLLSIGAFVIQHTIGKFDIHPRITGKLSTVAQMGLVLWILFKWDERGLPFWIWSAAILTTVSGFLYFMDFNRQLNASSNNESTKTH